VLVSVQVPRQQWRPQTKEFSGQQSSSSRHAPGQQSPLQQMSPLSQARWQRPQFSVVVMSVQTPEQQSSPSGQT